jgi:tetratricopeptide (TPR) repeat protein
VGGPSVTNSPIGGHNIQIGDVTGNVSILLNRRSFRLELLQPVESPLLDPEARHQPSYLLRPGNQVVPYRPPVEDLLALSRWRDGREDRSVLLLHGPGGQGKTRTAQHFAACASADGWSVAQARDLSTAAPVLPPAQALPSDRLLIVVDYAERWPHKRLLAMLQSTREDYPARVLRVLLLARSAPHQWDPLMAELEPLHIAWAKPIELTGFGGTPREALFAEAATAFAHALGVPEVSPPAPDDLADPAYASPLTLHMAALAGVVAAVQDDARPTDISHYLLLHEQRRWNTSVAAETVRSLVVLATLFGPVRTRDAARALLLAIGAADGRHEADKALKAHRAVYPSKWHLAPLRPDRFAEDFLGWHLSRDPDAADDLAALLTGDGAVLQEGDIRQALIVLANAARHEPVRGLLDEVITKRPDLAETSPAIMLAVAEHLPPHTAMEIALRPAGAVELTYARLKLAERAAHAIPEGAPALADIGGLWLLGKSLMDYGDHAQAEVVLGKAVRRMRERHDDPVAGNPVDLADLLNLYAESLAFSGRESDSVRVMAEAIELLREQPPGSTEDEASRRKRVLARSLSNQANALAGVEDLRGALAAAKESVGLYEELAAQDAEEYAVALVRAEARVGGLLHDLGRPEEAVRIGRKAADALRWLSADDPEAHRIDYADTLFNLALSLKEIGQTGHAALALSEAADLYRYLAQHIPLRFLDRLGECLHALSGVLEDLGRAGEMVTVLRELVTVEQQLRQESEPDDRRYAITMFSLGQQLAGLEDYEHAVPALTEAIDLCRNLAGLYPEGAGYAMSAALVMLSIAQSALGDTEAAVVRAREAVGMLREQSDGSAEAVGRLGLALQQLASCLPEDAVERTAALAEFDELHGTGLPWDEEGPDARDG